MAKGYNFNFNRVETAGRLTVDPKFITFEDTNNRVVYFSLASNRSNRKSNGERTEETLFLDCQAWNAMADSLQWLKRGSEILVVGHLESYRDKNNKNSLRLVAESYLPGPNFSKNNGNVSMSEEGELIRD